jgi:hypothetical protein
MSRSLTAALTGLGLAIALVSGQPITTVHPDFNISTLRPPGFNPQVSGLDFLPDGRLVVSTWEGFGNTKGSVYLVSNAQTGDVSKITYKKFASNLNEPLGVKVVGGQIYLLQKDQLSWLPDKNNDGVADTVQKVAGGWTVQPGAAKNLEFAMGLVYRDSVFYAGLAIAYPFGSTETKERGCIIQISTKTGGFTPYACGTRTPDGLVLGPEGELFTTENQGNWVPSSKLLEVKQGRFFGVHAPASGGGPGPFDNVPVTPPVLWMDHGNISISPTQPAYLTSGIYQGQMVAGDNNLGTLQRYFLEKVGGDYQGCIFRFSGGLEAAGHRIIVGPDGALYVGGLGTPEWGGWDWAGKDYGLQRMVPNGKKVFDWLAVRSMGATSMELEFTTPIGSGADQAANYKVQQWAYIPVADYGAGKQATENLTVTSAAVSADKMRVTLVIPGLKLKDAVYIKLSNITGQDNSAPWSTESWYTLNAFGPAAPVSLSAPKTSPSNVSGSSLHAGLLSNGRLRISVSSSGPFTIDIRNLNGQVLETLHGAGTTEILSKGQYGHGVHALLLYDGRGIQSRALVSGGA